MTGSFFRSFAVFVSLIAAVIPNAHAAKAPKSAKATKAEAPAADIGADVQAAKILLETIVSSRYQREMATYLNEDSFRISTEISLQERPPKVDSTGLEVVSDGAFVPADLMLGRMTPEELVAKLNSDTGQDVERARTLLSGYRIVLARISAGLAPDTPEDAKKKVEEWLKDRVNKEFGKTGSASLQTLTIVAKPEKPALPEKPKSTLEQMRDFQPLIGQALLALAILLAVMFWQGIGYRLKYRDLAETKGDKSVKETQTIRDANGNPTTPAAAAAAEVERAEEKKSADLRSKILEILPQFESVAEPLVKHWCNQGVEGLRKIALLSESAGSRLGRLPVPADLKKEVGRAFESALELPSAERFALLTKIYTDIVTAAKVGLESFDRPFSSIGQVRSESIREAMMANGTRFQTVVSLFMPAATQNELMRDLPFDAKKNVLIEALELSEVEESELARTEMELRNLLSSGQPLGRVKVDSPFANLLRHFKPLEEIRALRTVRSAAFDALKRKEFTFVGLVEWNDESLSRLLSRALPEEIAVFLSEYEEHAPRFFGLCPPMTAELARDELGQVAKLDADRKDEILGGFRTRIAEMIAAGELRLATALPALENSDGPVARAA